MNLYEIKTKSYNHTFYVVAEHPTEAQQYLKLLMNLADYDFYSNRDAVEIKWIAKHVTPSDWDGKPSFNQGNNLLIVDMKQLQDLNKTQKG